MGHAPQHPWFDVLYVVSANGGKRLNLSLYAVLKQIFTATGSGLVVVGTRVHSSAV